MVKRCRVTCSRRNMLEFLIIVALMGLMVWITIKMKDRD